MARVLLKNYLYWTEFSSSTIKEKLEKYVEARIYGKNYLKNAIAGITWEV